jgi:hypothetical protein
MSPTTLYAARSRWRVQSTDSGANWAPTGNGVIYPYNRVPLLTPSILAVCRARFAAGSVSWLNTGGMYKTTDAGDSYRK